MEWPVAQGLIFAIKWSQHQGYLAAAAEETALAILTRLGFLMPKEFVREFRVMTRSKLLKLVSEDKKLIDTRNLNFVFLEHIGAVFEKSHARILLTETQRHGWTYLSETP